MQFSKTITRTSVCERDEMTLFIMLFTDHFEQHLVWFAVDPIHYCSSCKCVDKRYTFMVLKCISRHIIIPLQCYSMLFMSIV